MQCLIRPLVPPSHLTLAKPKSWLKNTAFTPSALFSAEPSWQMMWHGLKVEVVRFQHRPFHRYLDMRQECRTFKRVALVIGCFYSKLRGYKELH